METNRKQVLSICMPTYNRPECVERSLAHYAHIISELRLRQKVEVCISDNSEGRETYNVVRKFSKSISIRYRRNGKNLGYDRNVINALSLASGAFLQLVGDELLYDAQALRKALSMLEGGNCDAIIFDDDRLFGRLEGKGKGLREGKEVWRRVLSDEWVRKRSITHIDYVIIKREHFHLYLRKLGSRIKGLYGLTFIQLSFYFFALKRCRSVGVVDHVNDPSASNVPKKVGVYFPSDDARVFYHKYFFEWRACEELGIFGPQEYEVFKSSFLHSALHHLLRIRTHMYPRIYWRERQAVLSHVLAVEGNYSGVNRLVLSAMRHALFTSMVPYHLLYIGLVFFRTRVLGQPYVSAIDLYEKCLDNEELGKSSLYKTDF